MSNQKNYNNTVKFLRSKGIEIYEDETYKGNKFFTNGIWEFKKDIKVGNHQVVFMGGHDVYGGDNGKDCIFMEPYSQWNKGRDSNFVIKMPGSNLQRDRLFKIIEILDVINRNQVDYFNFPEWSVNDDTGEIISNIDFENLEYDQDVYDYMICTEFYGSAKFVLKELIRLKNLHDDRIKSLKDSGLYDAYVENVKRETKDNE